MSEAAILKLQREVAALTERVRDEAMMAPSSPKGGPTGVPLPPGPYYIDSPRPLTEVEPHWRRFEPTADASRLYARH